MCTIPYHICISVRSSLHRRPRVRVHVPAAASAANRLTSGFGSRCRGVLSARRRRRAAAQRTAWPRARRVSRAAGAFQYRNEKYGSVSAARARASRPSWASLDFVDAPPLLCLCLLLLCSSASRASSLYTPPLRHYRPAAVAPWQGHSALSKSSGPDDVLAKALAQRRLFRRSSQSVADTARYSLAPSAAAVLSGAVSAQSWTAIGRLGCRPATDRCGWPPAPFSPCSVPRPAAQLGKAKKQRVTCCLAARDRNGAATHSSPAAPAQPRRCSHAARHGRQAAPPINAA